MKTSYNKKLAAYSTLAATLFLDPENLRSQVVHHDFLPDISLNVGSDYGDIHEQSLLLDLDLDNNADFNFKIWGYSAWCSACDPSLGGLIHAFSMNGIAEGKFYSGTTSSGEPLTRYFAQPFSSLEIIDSDLQFDNWARLNHKAGTSSSFLYNVGPWHTGATYFIGMKLHFTDGDHLGWLRLSCDDGFLIVKDCAYNMQVNEAVVTGKWDRENSANFIISAFNGHISASAIAGIGEEMRFMLFTTSGQMVVERIYSDQNTSIDVSPDVPNGIYLGVIQTGQGVYSQKLIIAR